MIFLKSKPAQRSGKEPGKNTQLVRVRAKTNLSASWWRLSRNFIFERGRLEASRGILILPWSIQFVSFSATLPASIMGNSEDRKT